MKTVINERVLDALLSSRPGVRDMPGTLFDSDAHVLVCQVNCAGVPDRAFKRRYPSLVAPYRGLCADRQLYPGKTRLLFVGYRSVALMATRYHWKDASHLEYFVAGLQSLIQAMITHGLTHAAMAYDNSLDFRQAVTSAFASTDIRIDMHKEPLT